MPTFSWNEATSYDELSPITQVSGFCFDENGNILLLRQTEVPDKKWNIPGGHPEAGETLDKTLAREVYEETTVRIGECGFIGYQKVCDSSTIICYQLRFATMIETIDPQKIDPAKGVIHERLFVDPNKVMDYIVYPQYREALDAAMRWYEHRKTK